MLHRTTSSRRRRASRSAASSPSTAPATAAPPRTLGTRSAATSPGRRASIAVSPVDGGGRLLPEPAVNRSPRHSIIPDIYTEQSGGEHRPLGGGGDGMSSPTSPSRSRSVSPARRASIAVSPGDDSRGLVPRSPRHSLVPDVRVEQEIATTLGEYSSRNRSPRHSLVPDSAFSPRNSLVPDCQRSPRHSLVPNDFSRSPRNSLVPDSALSPRNSLVPDQFNRSPRNSLVPEQNRTPRHSLTPENTNVYGSRLSIAEYSRSPRNSLVPGSDRAPRQSITPSESTTWNNEDVSGSGRSPRHSICPEQGGGQRSPRGSIAPEALLARTSSPRGSIAGEYPGDNKSPRGSIGPENGIDRSPRGSLSARSGLMPEESVGNKSPRGSLTLTFQEPPSGDARRSSADNTQGNNRRSNSPYRSASRGNVNMAYSGFSESGSRRASSSVSQVSGDEQRRLCAVSDQKYGAQAPVALTTYGSVAYQLKDANLEASGTCDFVYRALTIVNKTVVVTIVLVCLSVLPLIMLIMGIQFLRDCPREPNIPVYMVVGGSIGCIKMGLTLWSQLHTRRMDVSPMNATSIGSKLASVALTVILITWFGLGNYWILRIKWPDYQPTTLFEPNNWCDKTLYVFALVHLCIVYALLAVLVALVVVLAGCQLFGCPWLGPARYK